MKAAPVGGEFAHYRLEAPLGAGRRGNVFLGRDTRSGRQVAIRTIPPDRLDEDARRRVHAEAQLLSRLNHPNIASVLEFGSHRGIDYLVMEYVPGGPLGMLLRHGPLPTHEVASLGVQLARGLAAAHLGGIVHRDIKPGNLRVGPDGLLKILGFGTGTLDVGSSCSDTGQKSPGPAGTIQYMAPERLRGDAADPRADIFSSGAVLYEMACGRTPFPDTHSGSLIEAILKGEVPLPSQVYPGVDSTLERIIIRALEPQPARRFKRAADLADALEPLRLPPARSSSLGSVMRWAGQMMIV